MADDKLMDDVFDALGNNFVFNKLLEDDENWADYYKLTIEPVYKSFARFETPQRIVMFIVENGRNGLDILNQALIEASSARKKVQEMQAIADEANAQLKSANMAYDTLHIKYGLAETCNNGEKVSYPKCPCKAKLPKQQR